MHVQHERLYSYFRFARDIIRVCCCDKKIYNYFTHVNNVNNVFFRWLNLVIPLLFWRNARFAVILTSVSIIKHNFFVICFCYESLLGKEVTNHKHILKYHIIGTFHSPGSGNVITNVNIMTWINPLKFFYENYRRIHDCLKWKCKRSVLDN